MSTLAPVVLFVYARPVHTKQTLDALSANILSEDTNLIIYVDAANIISEEGQVQKVLDIVHEQSGFRSVRVIQRERNVGLAHNIIEGVSDVCSEYGKVIVLEDDIVTSPYFLTYMNEALNRYEENIDVWHISGWNYPIDPRGLSDTFLWRVMNCWGWATWTDRWQYFRKDPCQLIDTWDKKKIRSFNVENTYDFWRQVTDNANGRLNTWAIFWYATIFEHNGLCLNPSMSLIQNIGLDGSGIHCGENDLYDLEAAKTRVLEFPSKIIESELAVTKIKKFYSGLNPSLGKRLLGFLKQLP